MDFENPQIEIDSLPRVEDLSFELLKKDYLKLIYINLAIFGLILLVSLVAGVQFGIGWDSPVLSYGIIGGGFLLFITIAILEVIGYYRKAYSLRSHDIVYTSGVIIKRFTVVPFNRVQHCEVVQGPIDKVFELAKLKVYTAGGGGSDLSIPGLSVSQAHRLRIYILKKTVLDEEE